MRNVSNVFPLHGLALALCALGAAIIMHGLYRIAEALERMKRVPSRDFIMLPALLVLAVALAVTLDWLGHRDAGWLRDGGFAVFLGLAIGQRIPRPPRRPR